jgi:hypothetical protein
MSRVPSLKKSAKSANLHHLDLMCQVNQEFVGKLKHAGMMRELNREFRGVIVKNTFFEIDDSDAEQDAPLMRKLKTEPGPRRPSQDSDLSDDMDEQDCSSEVSTDDECPVAAAKCEASSDLLLPIPSRRSRVTWADAIEQDDLKPFSKSVSQGSNQERTLFAPTPSTVYHLTPRSKSVNYDSNQTYDFIATTPSAARQLTPRRASEGSADQICNSCTAPGVAIPEASASVNAKIPPSAAVGLSLLGMPLEKTTWEKFEEAVDGVQRVLASYHGLVADVKVVEGARGWTVAVFVEPELLICRRENLMAVAKQALILAAMALEGVYVVGCMAQPFTLTGSGFEATLAVMADPEHACLDTFTTGFCPNPGCCLKQHLKRQNSAGLEVVFKPFR